MKTVCITQNDDGSFTVEVEPTAPQEAPEAPEGAENGAADMAEDQAEGEQSIQCASIKEALSAVSQMFAENPQMDGEAAFTGGFKGVRGNGLNG